MTDKKGSPVPKARTSKLLVLILKEILKLLNQPEDIKCELQLQALSDFERLKFDIDYDEFKKQMKTHEDSGSYLQREGLSNPRQGLCLFGLPGDSCTDSLSLSEARIRTGNKKLHELDFNTQHNYTKI